MQLRDKNRTGLTKADAVRYSYRLLSYRDRSRKELGERLKEKGFSEDTVRDAVSYFEERGFLDDAALAKALKRSAEEIKLLGEQRVRLFLRQRGISKEIIKDIFAGGDSDEISRAERLVRKKFRTMKSLPDEESRKKMWRFMGRKGYSFDTIKKALKQFKIKEEEE